MLGTVALTQRHVEQYAEIAGEDAVAELHALAEPLRGKRIVNLSLGAFGTGVTDLLSGAVPLLQDLGVEASWYVVRVTHEVESELNALYAAMNGSGDAWTAEMRQRWEQFSEASAASLGTPSDAVIIHDPQLVGLAPARDERRNGNSRRWIWHSHHDLSGAGVAVSNDLRLYGERFDAIALEDPAFLPRGWEYARQAGSIIPPAIDPLGPRNVALDGETAALLLSRFGIDPGRPFIAQLSPLEAGSDIHGLIEAYDTLHERFPNLQLVIVPTAVRNDQATRTYFDQIARAAHERGDCILMPVAGDVGNAEINAVQQLAAVIVQKSLQRGYALWLAESMWKERPIVAGRTTGTVAQVIDGENGFLVPDTAACVERVSRLLSDPALRARIGTSGRRYVRERFLMTRYVADTLRLLARVVGAS